MNGGVRLELMNTSTAVFTGSAPDLESCPEEDLPEFAFAGRSNVGKSSLLNLLVGKRDLARVSPTPGHTKHLNFFTINNRWRLVDMPGYGYARVQRKERGRFSKAVLDYLKERSNLQCVFVLLDGSLPPQGNDLEFLDWLVENGVPFVLVFTKADKVSQTALQTTIDGVKAHLLGLSDTPPEVMVCSSVAGQGRNALLALIDSVLEPEAKRVQARTPIPRDTPW
jgi:GTP-binding protein